MGESFLQEGNSRLGLDYTEALVGQQSEHHIEREPQTRAGPMCMFGWGERGHEGLGEELGQTMAMTAREAGQRHGG